ncbi:MAG: hypothetical protein P8N67_03825 [Pseudomonadales bacterium]|nr:hypothetical protein [Pseudomonadales bacterium]
MHNLTNDPLSLRTLENDSEANRLIFPIIWLRNLDRGIIFTRKPLDLPMIVDRFIGPF